MSKHYPYKFTLEDGVNVVVNPEGNNSYNFTLTTEKGQQSHFTIAGEDGLKDETESLLNFDQLNAVRRFWLEKDDIV